MDLGNLEFYYYFAAGGGALLLIGLVLYFIPGGKLQMPAVVTAGIGGLVAGVALGILLMTAFGYKTKVEPKGGETQMTGPPPGMGGPPGFGIIFSRSAFIWS